MEMTQINTPQPAAATTVAEAKGAEAGHLASAKQTFVQKDVRQERGEQPEQQEQQSGKSEQTAHGAEQDTGVLSAVPTQGSTSLPSSHDQTMGNQGLKSDKDKQDDHKRWTADENEKQAAASAPYINWMGEKVFPNEQEEEEREA
jgi:hypothetical protein